MEKDDRQAQQNSQQIQSIIPDRQHIRKPTDKQSVVKRCFQGRKTCDDSPLAYRRPFAWKGKTFGTACPDGIRRKPLRHLNLKGNVSEPSSLKPVHPGGRLHSSSTKDCSAPRGQGNASPSPVCNGLLIRILFRRFSVRATRRQKNPFPATQAGNGFQRSTAGTVIFSASPGNARTFRQAVSAPSGSAGWGPRPPECRWRG